MNIAYHQELEKGMKKNGDDKILKQKSILRKVKGFFGYIPSICVKFRNLYVLKYAIDM